MSKVLNIKNDKGRRFNVRIITNGDKYGRNHALTMTSNSPQVEFYDPMWPESAHPELGQFIGRYYITTLQDRDRNQGLDLHGGVPEWGIDADAMQFVHDFLDESL